MVDLDQSRQRTAKAIAEKARDTQDPGGRHLDQLQEALGPDVREAPAETLPDVEVGQARAGTAHLTRGDGDGAVCEAHDTAVGESDSEDRRGEGGAGGVAMMMGLTVDVPGDGPDLGGDGLQPSGWAQGGLAKSAGEGGERCDRDKEMGAGGPPWCAVLCEATARDDGVDRGGTGAAGPRWAGRRENRGRRGRGSARLWRAV